MTDVHDWSGPQDWPDFETTTEAATPATVSIDGREYAVDLAEGNYQRRTVPSLRDTIITGEQADDSLYSSDAAWSRYAYSWHHGAGADTHDFGDPIDPFRFVYSSGIDPWDPYKLRLQRQMVVDSYAEPRLAEVIYAANGYFIGVDIVNNKIWYGLAGTPGNWSEPLTGVSNPRCLESFGYRLYVGTTTKIQSLDFIGGGFTLSDFHTAPSLTWTMLRYAAGRFFGFAGGTMYEISAGGTSTTVFTPLAGSGVSFRWTCCFSLGSRIYAGGHDFNVSNLYSFQSDSVGNLFRSNEALDMPPGELIYCATPAFGVVLLGTSRGIRLARPAGDGTLEYGPLIGVVGEEIQAYSDIVVDGRWAFARGTDPITGDGCLIRIDLATFVAPLAPAWSHDMTLRSGTFAGNSSSGARALAMRPGSSTTGAPRQLLTFGTVSGKYRAIHGGHGPRFVYGGFTSTYPYDDEGTIVAAPVFFGTIETKQLHAVQLVASDLGIGESLGVEVLDENELHVGSGVASFDGETGLSGMVLDLHGQEVEQARVEVTLRSEDAVTTPVLYRWRLRGFPVVPPVQQWVIPLVVHSRVVVGPNRGRERAVDVQAEIDALMDLWSAKAVVDFREGERGHRVRIEDVQVTARKWTPDYQGFEASVVVRLLSV